MKSPITKKWLKQMYSAKNTIQVGYCELQWLLDNVHSADYYTYGMYGWNFDAYDIDGILITTGYRGMFGKRVPLSLCEEYNNKARDLIHEKGYSKETNEQLDTLLKEFLEKAVA